MKSDIESGAFGVTFDLDVHGRFATATLPARVHATPRGLTRVSFCTTDGWDTWEIESGKRSFWQRLSVVARKQLEREYEGACAEGTDVTVHTLDSGHVIAIATRRAGTPHRRDVHLFFDGPLKRMWRVCVLYDTLTPEQELVAELVEWAQSIAPMP